MGFDCHSDGFGLVLADLLEFLDGVFVHVNLDVLAAFEFAWSSAAATAAP